MGRRDKTINDGESAVSDLAFSWVFFLVTGAVAFHGLTFRDKNGEKEIVHLLFGAIALLYCVHELFVEILGVIKF